MNIQLSQRITERLTGNRIMDADALTTGIRPRVLATPSAELLLDKRQTCYDFSVDNSPITPCKSAMDQYQTG